MMGWGVHQEQGWRKGPWTPEEDKLLVQYVSSHGEGRWTSVSTSSGLNRSGKSCRLRWVNYLRPGLKREKLTPQEEGIIVELHALYGNKWSTIARYLPGRTDNEIKNYWRTHFKKNEKSKKIEKRKIQFPLQKQQYEKQRKQQYEKQRKQQYEKQRKQQSETKMASIQAEEFNTTIDELAREKQHAIFMYPTSLEDDQGLNVMQQEVVDGPLWSDTGEDDFLWSVDLWNS